MCLCMNKEKENNYKEKRNNQSSCLYIKSDSVSEDITWMRKRNIKS